MLRFLSDVVGRNGSRSLRSYLVGLVLVALLPALLASAIAVDEAGEAHLEASRAQLMGSADTLASGMEVLLKGATGLVVTAAGMPYLRPREREIAEDRLGQLGTLLSNKVMIEMVPPAGDPARFTQGGVPVDFARMVLTTGRPATSDPFVTPGETVRRVAIAAPVPTIAPAILVMLVRPEQIVAVPKVDEAGSARPLITVVDSQGRIIERSRDGERFQGVAGAHWPDIEAQMGPWGHGAACWPFAPWTVRR